MSLYAKDAYKRAARMVGYALTLTPAQITDMGLPTAPAKETDRRSFEGETVQAEAIPPDRLCAILLDAITSRQDQIVRGDLLDEEDWAKGFAQSITHQSRRRGWQSVECWPWTIRATFLP